MTIKVVKIEPYSVNTNADAHPIENMRNSIKGYFYIECLYWKVFLSVANVIYKIRSYFFYPIVPTMNDAISKNGTDLAKWLL